MKESNTLSTMSAIRSDRDLLLSLEVLIEVPGLKGSRIGHGKTQSLWREATSRPKHRRTKRRLRREVRVAGCALLALIPLVSACTIGWSGQPGRVVACSIADTAADSRSLSASAPRDRAIEPGNDSLRGANGAVVLSGEPGPHVPGNDPEVPVVFPGFLLPDDGVEDGSHEGS